MTSKRSVSLIYVPTSSQWIILERVSEINYRQCPKVVSVTFCFQTCKPALKEKQDAQLPPRSFPPCDLVLNEKGHSAANLVLSELKKISIFFENLKLRSEKAIFRTISFLDVCYNKFATFLLIRKLFVETFLVGRSFK